MEKWKKIKNYPYSISNKGRVRREEDKTCGKKGHILSFEDNKRVYCQFKVTKWFNVHRLVAEHFIETLSENAVINHKDGNKKNNNVSNLEITTCKGNTKHAIANNLRKPRFAPRLIEKQVKEIRKAVAKGFSQYKVAKLFGVSNATVNSIVNRKTWKHVH